jgi:cell division transport system permease protein
VLVYYLYDSVVGYIIGRFPVIQSLFAFVSITDLFRVLVPAAAIIGIGLGLIGSMMATRKHLRV